MRKTVLYREGHRYVKRPVFNALRAHIKGVRYLKCFTNRWWSPGLAAIGAHRYIVTEVSTGFTPIGFCCASRAEAIMYAGITLHRKTRPVVLGAIARIKSGHIINKRVPQYLKLRTR